jgi:hypothetical protein
MTEDPHIQPATEPAPATPRAPRPISRWGVGTLTLLQLVFAAIILVGVNFLAGSRPQRQDLSEQRDFTLSPLTRKFLNATAASHPDPIKIIVAVRRSSPFMTRIRGLAEEYQLRSRGKITVEFVDPVQSSDRIQTVSNTYGIKSSRDLLIVDARPASALAATPAQPGTGGEMPALSGHVRFVSIDDMLLYQTRDGERRPVAFQGEDAISAALVAAVEGTPRMFYLLADKSDLRHDAPESAWKNLALALFQQNIHLKSINLAETARIPDDAEGVALIAPRYDLEAAELEVLREYWGRPRSAILVTADPNHRPQRLRAFLREHGVSWRNDRVVTLRAGQTQTTVRATFTEGMEFTRDFWSKSTVFEGATASLEVRENAEDLLNRRISVYSLIHSTEDYWGESQFSEPPTTFDPKEDKQGPVTLAAGIIRGTATDDNLADLTSKMLVFSNSSFLEPALAREEQMDFLTTGVNWLIDRPALMGVGPLTLRTYKLPLLDAEAAFINRINLFFLPAFGLVISLVVWQTRRA